MERVFELIDNYDIITLFRHQAADSDALGSQFAFKQWINECYPKKQVYALGTSIGSKGCLFSAIDTVDDETVGQSLAIILDTANASRIDDDRWQLAKYKVKIDHHIFVERYGDLEIIEDRKGATCEILAAALEQRGETLSKTCAEYLYSGLIADTLQFSINATTPEMLRTAAYLVAQGVDVAKVNEANFSKSFAEFQFENYIREHFQWKSNCLAYCKITKAEYEQFHLTFNEAKEKVYALGKVNEFCGWALFVETERTASGELLYNGSLRSRNIAIHDIAAQFHGGGHRYACGVKNLNEETVDELLETLANRLACKTSQ